MTVVVNISSKNMCTNQLVFVWACGLTLAHIRWEYGPCMGRRIDLNNEGGFDTYKTIFQYIGKLNPGCSSRTKPALA